MCRATQNVGRSPASVRPASPKLTARSTRLATTAAIRPITAPLAGVNGSTSTLPRTAATSVPSIAPSTTPVAPRGTCGAIRGFGKIASVTRATSSATPAAAAQTSTVWVPDGTRVRITGIAYATTPSTITRVVRHESLTRARSSDRNNWPISATTKPPSATSSRVNRPVLSRSVAR
jgi:hypothetical protein